MNPKNIYLDNTPLSEALSRWDEALLKHGLLSPLSDEEIPVDDSLSRITAEAVYARRSSPFCNAAAMDGIAVRFKDTIGASEAHPVHLSSKKYLPVNTGNAIPEGYDAVIMIEDVHQVDKETVEIISAVPPWQHVRTIGEDIVTTELILPEGHTIRPIDIGAMLATDVNTVKVRRVPQTIVIPTGSELVQPGEPVQPGNIIEFNSRILAGYLHEWGASATRGPLVRDAHERIKQAVKEAAGKYDIVITNAGASAGTRDYTAHVLDELGEIVVHGVNIKPGKPVILAIVDNKPVIGLPGYPVSAVLTMRIFVRRLIASMLGQEQPEPQTAQATLSRPLSSKMGVLDFVRIKLGRVTDHLMATPISRGAGAVMSLVQADGILTVPAGSEGVGAGETVSVELLRNLTEIDNTLVFIGSHDNILDVLANMLHQLRPVRRLSSAHVGSMGGIMAIKRGEAHLAGAHLLDEKTGAYNVPFLKKYLKDVPLMLINLAYREQGLLVRKKNPKKIRGFADLARDDIRFINRQRGAGTRILIDMKLKENSILPKQVTGYDREEYTHMNIASAVAAGSVDTGLAIRAAAVALDLDFVPIAQERYDIIVPAVHAEDEKVKALLQIIRTNKTFKKTVNSLGGYDLRDCGSLMYEQ